MNDNYIMKVLDFKQEYMITKEEKVQIEEARDVAKVVNSIEGLGNSTRERFIMLGLDNKSYVTFIYNVHIGTLNTSLIHPRDCFKAAIENNSASVIFVHNHPSQNAFRSPEDVYTSKRLALCGEILGIQVLDSIIVTQEEYYSLHENNELELAIDTKDLF